MRNNENRHGYWHIASCAKQLSLNNSEFIVIFLFEFFDPSSMQLFVADGFIDWEEVSARIAENPNIKCEYEQQQDTVIGIGKRMTEQAPLCANSDAPVTSVWNEARQRSLVDLLAQSPYQGHAQHFIGSVSKAAENLALGHTSACEATFIGHSQSAELYDRHCEDSQAFRNA